MRKGEFKLKAERAYPIRYGRKVADYGFYYHTSYQCRWEETADPVILDKTFHFTEEEAIEAASKIKLEIGFYPIVDRCFIMYDDFNFEFEFGQEFEMEELFYEEADCVWTGDTYEGEDVTGSIIVQWSWEKHVGYCRNLEDIGIGGGHSFHNLKVMSDLITGNEHSRFARNFSVLLTKEEVEGLSGYSLQEAIEHALSDGWKWNYFKNNPSSAHIKETILEICNLKED
jgi:hypothetical protein